jgi:ribosome-binding protein aMBF1 (putative translation factor)
MMDAETRKKLQAEGYQVFDHAGDAVGMTDEEKQLMEIRVSLAISVRKRREQLKLTQAELAARLRTRTPVIAKIEQAARDVSFDQIFSAYVAMGGRIRLTELPTDSENSAKKTKNKTSKQRA